MTSDQLNSKKQPSKQDQDEIRVREQLPNYFDILEGVYIRGDMAGEAVTWEYDDHYSIIFDKNISWRRGCVILNQSTRNVFGCIPYWIQRDLQVWNLRSGSEIVERRDRPLPDCICANHIGHKTRVPLVKRLSYEGPNGPLCPKCEVAYRNRESKSKYLPGLPGRPALTNLLEVIDVPEEPKVEDSLRMDDVPGLFDDIPEPQGESIDVKSHSNEFHELLKLKQDVKPERWLEFLELCLGRELTIDEYVEADPLNVLNRPLDED